ncbi:hypothetical protein CEXT_468371 [Caerostris extrusa]|uniref:Uncharacterized protein n=1 Tax=Caerostris extrusa TaxID=172846 RepID=A0AAV4W0P9_CAEEX|nr:hypothetical protein CEXT_468371 [Caerostris extrusa]
MRKERSQDAARSRRGQGELRVLRAGQAAPPAWRHHHAAGQGLHHTTLHQLPQAQGLHRARGPPGTPPPPRPSRKGVDSRLIS